MVLPFVVLALLAISGKINFHGGGGWMLLVLLCMLSLIVASVVTVIAGSLFLARTQGGERARLMLL